jgi:hypothetical protein
MRVGLRESASVVALPPSPVFVVYLTDYLLN